VLSAAILTPEKVPFEIANKYCKEIEFKLNDQGYFASGVENKSEGFELRNEHFKVSSSSKNITGTEYKHNSKNEEVFEDFFTFISHHVWFKNQLWQLTNFLVLNSLSLLKKAFVDGKI
jgi:hypothetical protein